MSTPSYLAKLDGAELRAALSFAVRDVDGLWQTPAVTLDEQAIYQQAGAVLMDQEPATAVRELVINGTLLAADQSDFETKLLALKRALGPIGRVDHVLIFGNQTAKQITARYVGLSDGPTGPQFVQGKVPIALHFRSRDPYFIDVTPTTVAASAGVPVAIPLGTGLSTGVTTITLSGSASSVTRTYKSSAGTTLSAITLTHAFVTSDVIVIDDTQRIITLNGVRHEDLVTAGGFVRFSPADGVPATPAWPTIETNHGALSLTYAQTWE